MFVRTVLASQYLNLGRIMSRNVRKVIIDFRGESIPLRFPI